MSDIREEALMIDHLIERVESAEGPDRELDMLIHALCFPDDLHQCKTVHIGCAGFRNGYTRYLDAAWALLKTKLLDARGGIDFGFNENGTYGASVEPLLFDARGEDYYGHHYAKAPTPALALLAAFLRAWKEQNNER